jgi:hypothetical protein
VVKKPKIGVIMSGRYVSEGLMAEIGQIPPSMLPLGNMQLLYHQFTLLKNLVDRVYILFPETYALHPIDKIRIEKCGLQILNVDPTVSIGHAISHCIDNITYDIYDLYILYGDTLFKNITHFAPDSVSVHKKWGEYGWAQVDLDAEKKLDFDDLTLSGLFSFSDVTALSRCIDYAHGDFLEAIRAYNANFQFECNESGEWYDFGHVQTYFRSVGLVTTQRSFNTINVMDNAYQKSSLNHKKIIAEAAWFENIPAHLRAYTPAFLGLSNEENKFSYSTENTFLSTLSNLAVFGDLQEHTWDKIFHACGTCLKNFQNISPEFELPISCKDYFPEKTNNRLIELNTGSLGGMLFQCDRVNDFAIPNLDEVLFVTSEIINKNSYQKQCLIHGDFCFSNIFYDFRSSMIRVIDPRGELPDGTPSIYGVPEYDLAKLAHSVFGGYDLIISNYMPSNLLEKTIEIDTSFIESERWQKVTRAFKNSDIYQSQDQEFLIAMIVHLFLSMLPLHSERPDRQISIFGVAILIYNKYIG